MNSQRHSFELLNRNLSHGISNRKYLILFDGQIPNSSLMNSLVPGRPVSRNHNGPPSLSKRRSISKNGQHNRSWNAHSVSSRYVLLSAGNSNSKPSGSSRVLFVSFSNAGSSSSKWSFLASGDNARALQAKGEKS